MLSTIDLVVGALSTTNKIGLASVGAAFIVFALVSSFVLPRRNPNFPGRAVGWYSALAVLFLVAMISAVLVFGKETEEVAGESQARTETVSGSLPGQTTSTPRGTTTAPTVVPGGDSGGEDSGGADDNGAGANGGNSGAGGVGGGESEGDATAGKAVFAKNSCGSCHTLKAAAASGNVGPNLDDLKPDFGDVKDQVEHGGGLMPAYKDTLSEQQIEDVAAFVSSSAGS
jgi:mono/diheme cytochrome c family protein